MLSGEDSKSYEFVGSDIKHMRNVIRVLLEVYTQDMCYILLNVLYYCMYETIYKLPCVMLSILKQINKLNIINVY